MLGKRQLGAQRKEKVDALPGLGSRALDVRLERLIAHDDVVFLGKAFDARRQMRGISDIQREHAEEIADHKRERQIVRQPVERREHVGVNEEIIHRAQKKENSGQINP